VTPKERVVTTLQRREPDRVPMGEFAFDHALIEHFTGKKSFWRPFSNAKAQIAIWEGRRDEVVESWKEAIDFLAQQLEHDLLPVQLAPSKYRQDEPPRQIAPGLWQDRHGNQFKYSPETDAIMQVRWADADREFTEDDFPITDIEPPDESEWEFVDYVVSKYGRTHFIFARSGDGSWPQPGGMEKSLTMMLEKPQVMAAAIRQATHRTIQLDRLFAQHGVDAVTPAVDYAMNSGPMFSPKIFERLMLPAIKEQVRAAHEAGLFVIKHACGNNWMLLDYFVEAGYDVYQSIQRSASMEICELKQRYGQKISLWGGVQVETLVRGTPEQVRAETIEAIRCAAPGGGFILGSSHSVVNATKPENYLAMLEAWREYRNYPIT